MPQRHTGLVMQWAGSWGLWGLLGAGPALYGATACKRLCRGFLFLGPIRAGKEKGGISFPEPCCLHKLQWLDCGCPCSTRILMCSPSFH